MLKNAVNAVVTSFQAHSKNDEVDAIKALKEFWLLKKCEGLHHHKIEYEVVTFQNSFVCYVTLPGGSCFGSYEVCNSIESAKQSAAKIALTNSVLNEHPCNIINLSTINQMLAMASSSFPARDLNGSCSPIEVFKLVLVNHLGKSFLSFQEKMSVFQLLHWNGNLMIMKNKECSRDEVLNHYLWRGVDKALRSNMINDWFLKEKSNVGTLCKEIDTVNCQISLAREKGHELRFYKEKLKILTDALVLRY